MFAEFKGLNGVIVRVVPEKVQGIIPRGEMFTFEGHKTDIYCSGCIFHVSETPEEVAKELQGLGRVV